MTTKTDGGPAFPVPGLSNLPNGEFLHPMPGMSLRDYFAAKVCAAVLTTTSADNNFPDPEFRHPRSGPSVGERVARISYQMADAMLAERSKS